MRWAEGFIAADWGTTNRRAWRLGPGGTVEEELEDESGILSVPDGGFPAAVAELRARLGDLPLLMGGMVGSNRGWIEAPYAPCPAGLEEVAGRLQWAEPGRTAIVPGVSFVGDGRADVMRGEEVQLLGAWAEGWLPEGTVVCHPGTHNKWARLEQGRIAAFRTVMTGEIYNLLKERSILADLLRNPVEPGDAFAAGVRHGLNNDDLTAELFAVRARVLLDQARAQDAAAYTSGLLIGSDLRIGLRFAGSAELVVMARPDLTNLFAAALGEAGREARRLDGEACFLAGTRRLAEHMA
ncbi:MAG: 2-dehydro-3-deoxygalactonokinase [Pseudomonadota bacterium]|nr:2-dehydro-3-deoxygalactonokinase [Pseudomonadota bacterium]